MTKQHFPYIIIGRGIAGSVLSTCLAKAGLHHLVIDAPLLSTSSKIAAGLVNPVVLKRLKVVANASNFIDIALPFYQNMEAKCSASFLHQTSVWHILHNQEEQNQWLEKSEHPKLRPFLNDTLSKNLNKYIIAPFGLGEVLGSFWVDTNVMLEAHKSSCQSFLLEHAIFEKNINLKDTIVTIKDKQYSFDHLIDCSGHLSRTYFPYLKNAFTPTKGEVLIIQSNELPKDQVLHAGIFILPLGNEKYKVGSTYAWDNFIDEPTKKGKIKLEEELQKIFKGHYTILDHQAGVRPNVKDRKPLVGQLSAGLYAFNGMGSRGVLMAPYLADVLIKHIEHGQLIPEQYQASRYLS